MSINRHWLMTGAAVVIALGAGFGVARVTAPTPLSAEAHADDHGEEHGEEDGHADEEGLVPLTAEAAEAAGVSITTPERGGGGELKLPGRIAFAPGAEAAVDAPLSGSVTRVHVGVGDRVSAGQALVTLRSPEGAASRADVDAAAAAVEAARAAEQRDRTLMEQGWVAQARLDVTAAEARRAEAQLRAARARAGAFGGPGADGLVVVRSPINGVVTRVSAAPGQFLHQEALQVAAVSDQNRLELVFDAPPSAAALLRPGDAINGSVAGGQPVSGVVTAVAPANAAGVVVVRARPVGATPPAGAVLSARVSTGGGEEGVLTVPVDSVQTVEGALSVFVLDAEGFRATVVTTGRTAEGRVEILSGLSGSERIAGTGAFLLKAQLGAGSVEHAH